MPDLIDLCGLFGGHSVEVLLIERQAVMSELPTKKHRLQAMSDAVLLYERGFGTISEAELMAQERADRRSAAIVRGRAGLTKRRKRGPAT